ncbi:hypothetical protein [Deinococcus sp. 23YEL01]|uniref:hypothetical protein n=1 Tax=Deinococcus sp. 23YEL01 TaxID=2745871 RepID=UPI001E348502|nr:hypothetical protein [Deinococcus sp. 23YEL01]
MTHGFYTTVPGVNVDELVQRYRESGLDPDATDDDMLYLRAYLDELKALRPDATQAAELLREGLGAMSGFLRMVTDEDHPFKTRKMSVQDALEIAGELERYRDALTGLRDTLKVIVSVTAGIEERHANLITLAKTRAETRLKNSASQQLDAFTVMVERLQVILQETLPSNYAEALQVRFARELNELPARAAKGAKA